MCTVFTIYFHTVPGFLDGRKSILVSSVIHCKAVFLKCEIKKCAQFLTDPFYLTIIMVK